MDLATDDVLVERCRRDRDRAAFDALVARHRQRVIGVAFARCRDVALAEDIAQEAFLVAWSGIDQLRAGDVVGRWLAGIARNLATSAARTRERRARVVFVAPELADVAGTAADPESALLEREDRALFERALADVDAAHREILVRYYLDGRSLADIARAAGVAEQVAKKRLSRAREAVRQAVAARADRAMARMRRPMVFSPFGKAIFVMASKQLVIVGVAVVLAVAGGAAWMLRGHDPEPVIPQTSASGSPPTASTSTPNAPAGAIDARPPPADLHVGRLERPAHDALLAQIRAAHVRAAAARTSSGGAAGPGPALPAGSDADPPMDKEYIRAAVHEIIPMLTDCYSEGLERNPKLAAGNVLVEFTIEGEKDVGGVVGDSKIDNTKTDLADATVRECIQQTMYALKLDPPPNGGTVTVRYPFAFSPAGEEPPAPPPQ